MRHWLILLVLGVCTGLAHAGKCVNGDKTLYSDTACPPGWRAAALGGNLSRISPEPETDAANQQFLRKREAEEREYQARLVREQNDLARSEINQCYMLASQMRQLESDYAARQRARLPEVENYRARNRYLRDQMARLRC
ncbi:hypothetical protein AB4Z48_15335 [Cupriavidus sp. 2TAF22]|uniref:hypothetical protein n=1 Tax=unclassified Cupriavidus TaxID=2640874 RepID=UPI003F9088D3